MRIWSDITSNAYRAVGDGSLTNFWDDVWLPHVGPLHKFYRRGGPYERNL